ncbi:MAG TPA: ATP-binding protein [Candidatus Sulfotelmatobacter sp.]|nr:ATP-binding protein [Candidatus Sulfotelmatobacter sp.]
MFFDQLGEPSGDDPGYPGAHDTVEVIAQWVAPVPPDVTCAVAFERFSEDVDLLVLPVVADTVPVGMINRQDIVMLWASQFGRSLFEHKPVRLIMDGEPFKVGHDLKIDALQSLLANEAPSALMRGFIVLDQGRYRGVGTVASLLYYNAHRTETRNRELTRAQAIAEQANRAKTRFLANMSHELRTPLNAVIGFSEVIQNELFGAVQPSRYLDYVGDIHASANHLLAIINDILDMAKIEARALSLEEETVDLRATVRWALRLIGRQAEEHGVALAAELAEDLPPLLADQRAVRQILLNLLSNAVKFTPRSGRVSLRAHVVATGEIEFEIADTGIGIADNHLQMVLEPFGQVASEINRNHQGTGLGLPLARAFVELHGGTFQMTSRLGEGTTVRVRFPAARTVLGHVTPAGQQAKGDAARRRPVDCVAETG